MSTDSRHLIVAGLGVEIVYKDIKNVHISVYPPRGRIRVAAPHRIDAETVRLAIVQRLPWIKRQRTKLREAARQTERQMVSGETHYVWGQRYRLDVSNVGKHSVSLKANTMQLTTPAGSDADVRRRLLDRYYRQQLKDALPPLLEKWEPVVGRKAKKVGIRKMKTKWGSCSANSGTIWINVELATKNPRCLEYVVVHELVHLIERGHGERFITLLSNALPDWKQRREELNDSVLAHQEWDC